MDGLLKSSLSKVAETGHWPAGKCHIGAGRSYGKFMTHEASRDQVYEEQQHPLLLTSA